MIKLETMGAITGIKWLNLKLETAIGHTFYIVSPKVEHVCITKAIIIV